MWPSIYDAEQNKVYDIPSRLLKDRIILLNEEINSETATSIVSQLLYLDTIAPNKEIIMYINSPGGSVTDGLSILDTMNAISSPVHTICNGMAASMGAFLLCSGSHGMREAMPNATIMIHQPLGGVQGQATEIAIAAKRILALKKKLYEIMAENTGKTYNQIETACERDNYLSAKEALEFGLIDKIIELPNKAKKPEVNTENQKQ